MVWAFSVVSLSVPLPNVPVSDLKSKEKKNENTKDTEKTPSKLLTGERHVALLLKAELEGDRAVAVDLEKRGTCTITPGGIGGLRIEGFEDDSSDDEDNGDNGRKAVVKSDVPGTEGYRPFVGGYVAAAYEAAKMHHYKAKQKETQNREKDKNLNLYKSNLPPPSI